MSQIKCPECGHRIAITAKRRGLPAAVFALVAVGGLAFGAWALAPQWSFLLKGEREPEEAPVVVEAVAVVEPDPEAELAAQEREREAERQREALLAKEIWLKANAEFLAGNLESASEILETVPEHESILEERTSLRQQLDDITQWMKSGRAAAWRGECDRAIGLFNRVLKVNPQVREATKGREACRRMLPPSIAE